MLELLLGQMNVLLSIVGGCHMLPTARYSLWLVSRECNFEEYDLSACISSFLNIYPFHHFAYQLINLISSKIFDKQFVLQ
mmetsp:Transcript_2839/g.4097  ORF Transcript_2839/g.4097 Transcript_2839/m.4097 type:complete len:80 (-) Transcript_2839:1146-1385(-)